MRRRLKDILFSNEDHQLIIKKKAVKVFRKYEWGRNGSESGGILLGHIYRSRTEIVQVTTPNKHDTWGPLFFIRSKIGAQPIINRAWKRSNKVLNYVGEWHTHPEVYPKPSDVDKRMIMKSFKETEMEIDFLYLIIVGCDNTYWVGKQMGNQLVELMRKNG